MEDVLAQLQTVYHDSDNAHKQAASEFLEQYQRSVRAD